MKGQLGQKLLSQVERLSVAAGYLDASLTPATFGQWLQRQYQVGDFDPDLRPGMVLAHAIRATSGAVVVGASRALTSDMIERLQRFVAVGGVDAVSVTLEDRGDVETRLLEIAT